MDSFGLFFVGALADFYNFSDVQKHKLMICKSEEDLNWCFLFTQEISWSSLVFQKVCLTPSNKNCNNNSKPYYHYESGHIFAAISLLHFM